MWTKYDLCNKNTFDLIRQLMKLADDDRNEEFIETVRENSDIIVNARELFKNAVIIGLVARNKAELLETLIKEMDIFISSDSTALFFLIDMLIMQEKNTDAVISIGSLLSDDPIGYNIGNMLDTAAEFDNLPVFKALHDKTLSDNSFFRDSIIIFSCGIRKNKKILDYITDCGRIFREKDKLDKIFFEPMFIQSFNFDFKSFMCEDDCNDVGLLWLRNIYSMYLDGMDSGEAYDILYSTAVNTGLISPDEYPCWNLREIQPLRKAGLFVICGHKTNDLTFLYNNRLEGMYDFSYSVNWNKLLEFVEKISGEAPFINYSDCGYCMELVKQECILDISKRLSVKLTVNLISDFGYDTISFLKDVADVAFDFKNEKTADYLRSFFLNDNYKLFMTSNKKIIRKNQKSILKFIIDNKYATTEEIINLLTAAGNMTLLKQLFDSCGK